MKKTTTLACAAMATIFASCASATEVVSSNIVGYSKLTMNANGYTMIANPFVEVGTGSLIGINDMFSNDKTDATAGTTINNSDNILVWDGSKYVTYWLKTNKKTGVTFWADGSGNATVLSLPEDGGAFYLSRANTSTTLTISGEVRSEPQTITMEVGYNLVENPFPSPLSVQTFYVEGATAGTTINNSDNILVWDGSKYVTYWLKTNKKTGVTFWADGSGNATSTSIDSYAAFFYMNRGNSSFTVTINPPSVSE